MYEKFRIQRSRPSKLNGVAPKNRIGTSLVRKKCRTSEMFLSRRRGVPEPEADAASVAMLTSPGVDVTAAAAFFARAGVARLTGAFFAAAFLTGAFFAAAFLTGAFLAGAFLTGAFLAAVFPAALLVRTGR